MLFVGAKGYWDASISWLRPSRYRWAILKNHWSICAPPLNSSPPKQHQPFIFGEALLLAGGGNSALQMVDNLHTVARNIHLISTSELTTDAAVVERVSCLLNLHTYIGCKVLEFTGDRTLAGITIRKKTGAESDQFRPQIRSG